MNKSAFLLFFMCCSALSAEMYTCVDRSGFKRLKNFKCDSDERTIDQQNYEGQAAGAYRPTQKSRPAKSQPANIADGLDLTSPAGVADFAARAQPIIESNAAKKQAAAPDEATSAEMSGCHKATILEPAPFMGAPNEFFKLSDGSAWKNQSYQSLYLYAYYPVVVICPTKGRMHFRNKELTLSRAL